MKKILILLFILVINSIKSQELKTITLLPPESKEYSDLHFLDNELKGKRLIMLGEMTHMYGNIFEIKARIVEYLYKELDFTTIAMESSMYDLWLMNKNSFDPDSFNDAIWGVWSGTEEFQRLVKFIEKNKIKVIGFDSQISNNSKFIEDFFDFIENNKINLKVDEDDLGIIIEGVLENFTFEEDDIKFKDYEKELNRIIKLIGKLEQTDVNYHWKQFIKNILTSSKDAYYNKKDILTMDFGNSNHNFRDQQMADNILTYLSRNPKEKVIVWADNIHIITNFSSINKPILKDFIPMGTHIKSVLKNDVYSLATLHANDSILDQKKWEATPIQKGSFEDKLCKLNTSYLFVSSEEGLKKPHKSRLLNFLDFSEMRLDQLHDGYIFLKHAKLPKREIENLTKEETDTLSALEEKIKIVSTSKNTVVLKGQVIDAETKLSIPYANIIMKNAEIYRVADDNGYFKLPVTTQMKNKGAVIISSMGFKSRTIALNKLTSIIKLKPTYEALDEVIIKSIASPKTILSRAIKAKSQNHPIEPFNFNRYAKIIINHSDKTHLDLELITKDYDDGYTSPFIITQRVSQIKWNKVVTKKNYKYSTQFFAYRQNAIRYANILHKRKYKKFKLRFVKSTKPRDDEYYIIAFNTDRNKWNYTNRGYPTEYSGKVYIRKDNYAIIKVVENWKTTLINAEIKKYIRSNYEFEKFKKKKQLIIKEENICTYSKVINHRNYASSYFRRIYSETLDTNDILDNSVLEIQSDLFDFETKNVEEIEFEFYKKERKQTVLKRVKYDESFWKSFYKNLK